MCLPRPAIVEKKKKKISQIAQINVFFFLFRHRILRFRRLRPTGNFESPDCLNFRIGIRSDDKNYLDNFCPCILYDLLIRRLCQRQNAQITKKYTRRAHSNNYRRRFKKVNSSLFFFLAQRSICQRKYKSEGLGLKWGPQLRPVRTITYTIVF